MAIVCLRSATLADALLSASVEPMHFRFRTLVLLATLLFADPTFAQHTTQKSPIFPSTLNMTTTFSLMPAKKAITKHKLLNFVSPAFKEQEDAVGHLSEFPFAIVFDGDVTIDDDISIIKYVQDAGSALARAALENRLLIFRGNLTCRSLYTDNLSGVFVFGDLKCNVVSFGCTPVFVKGNVVASLAILANAEDDEVFDAASEGKYWVRVDGTVSSPVVKTWHFRLSHLTFARDSGTEQLVERSEPQASGATFP